MKQWILLVLLTFISTGAMAGHYKCMVEIEGQKELKRMDIQADTESQAKAIIESDLQLMYGNSKKYSISKCEKLNDF